VKYKVVNNYVWSEKKFMESSTNMLCSQNYFQVYTAMFVEMSVDGGSGETPYKAVSLINKQ
jgi:hypothetical protein